MGSDCWDDERHSFSHNPLRPLHVQTGITAFSFWCVKCMFSGGWALQRTETMLWFPQHGFHSSACHGVREAIKCGFDFRNGEKINLGRKHFLQIHKSISEVLKPSLSLDRRMHRGCISQNAGKGFCWPTSVVSAQLTQLNVFPECFLLSSCWP